MTAFVPSLWIVLALLASMPARADLVATIERIKPSVVMVGIYRKLGAPQFTIRGSGFVVGDGRTVATNAHVVADLDLKDDAALVVRAATPPDRARPVTVLSIDKAHDLALLRMEGGQLPALSLRDSDSVKEGKSVAFTGFPIGGALGFSPVTHRATVSAITPIALPGSNSGQLKANVLRQLKEGTFNIFQLDGTAYPGNSGGPLFDAETHQVIGVVNMVLVKNNRESALSQPTGITYAVPVRYLRELLARV